ncbi:hypothetical protein NP233_g3929 [Leucocoprinus birnbaumii]|uniref:Uncharacterized protein n=1 Tax=Leucocoprinus birnbaumii TaxID=56174 RepID=A0AAD5VW47_9AGAR|nr:hypothetical protein NP233_g3929 [Leucocoprinus birnbaumii]
MPYLFASAYEANYNRTKKGSLLGNLVLHTLAAHFHLTNTLPKAAFTPKPKPAGALILAIQSAQRALIYAQSRKIKIPYSKADPATPFSAANWNNYTKAGDDGSLKSYAHASLFCKHVTTLTDQHWEDIIKGAHRYVSAESPLPVSDDIPMDMGSEDHNNLMDPDYDQPGDFDLAQPMPAFGVFGLSAYKQALEQENLQESGGAGNEEADDKQYGSKLGGMAFDVNMVEPHDGTYYSGEEGHKDGYESPDSDTSVSGSSSKSSLELLDDSDLEVSARGDEVEYEDVK